MISGPRIEVKIGGRTFSVPRLKDENTTYHIAKLLQERLKQIEAKSSRIDTQAFAIEAAMSFALDHLVAEETLDEETQEMMVALSELSKELQSICRDFDVESVEEEEQ
ncbi:MAG: cell division protein ZapA [Candidatus Hydrogenedentota bacterium]